MFQSKLRFYLDENMDPEIAKQLRWRGIDVLAARDVSSLSASDGAQLRHAATDGRVLCTKDAGFADPTTWDVEHDGIVFSPIAAFRLDTRSKPCKVSTATKPRKT